MRVHQESIREIDRYIANEGTYELADKIPFYERYVAFVSKLRPVDPSMRILEVGTGTGRIQLTQQLQGELLFGGGDDGFGLRVRRRSRGEGGLLDRVSGPVHDVQ